MLTDAEKFHYELAAVALLRHPGRMEPGPMAIAWRVADHRLAAMPGYDPTDQERIDDEAARLLRECVAKNEELPK